MLGPTLANRTDFIASNSAQNATPYEPLNIYWNCDVVTFRFEITFKPQPVLGITILETVPAPKDSRLPFKIKQVCLSRAEQKRFDRLTFGRSMESLTPGHSWSTWVCTSQTRRLPHRSAAWHRGSRKLAIGVNSSGHRLLCGAEWLMEEGVARQGKVAAHGTSPASTSRGARFGASPKNGSRSIVQRTLIL